MLDQLFMFLVVLLGYFKLFSCCCCFDSVIELPMSNYASANYIRYQYFKLHFNEFMCFTKNLVFMIKVVPIDLQIDLVIGLRSNLLH